MDNAAINHYTPDYTVTPGEVLGYELELRNMSRTELAKRTGLSEKHIIAILKGKGTVIITPETAIKLERALGMPVEYWLNLEAHYQETRARLAIHESGSLKVSPMVPSGRSAAKISPRWRP